MQSEAGMRRRTVLACMSIAATLFAPVSSAVASDPVGLSPADPFVGCSLGNFGTNWSGSQVEPSIASAASAARGFKRDLVALWQQDRWSNAGSKGIMSASSFDGGVTWKTTPLPFSTCATSSIGYARATDPWVSIGPDGVVYAVGMAFTPDNTGNPSDVTRPSSAVVGVTSDNGGASWSSPLLISMSPYVDKVAVTADPQRRGTAYVVWQEVTGTHFSRTTNGGRSWSTPQIIFPIRFGRTYASGNEILVTPRSGALLDFFDYGIKGGKKRTVCTGSSRCHQVRRTSKDPPFDAYIAFIESTNGGRTWSAPHVVSSDLWMPSRAEVAGQIHIGGNLPQSAIDPRTGYLYVVWEEGRFSAGRYDDVALSSSKDGGKQWSAPVRVNPLSHRDAFLPAVAVDGKGAVGVSYYSLRKPVDSSDASAGYWLRIVSPRTDRPGKEIHVAGPFDLSRAPLAGGHFVGDYVGIAPYGSRFAVLFVEANASDSQGVTHVMQRIVRG